jgi:hypothetical protein
MNRLIRGFTAIVASLLLTGCSDVQEEPETVENPLGVTISALTEECGGNPDPFLVIDSFRLCGEAPVAQDDGSVQVLKRFDTTTGVGSTEVSVNDIPAGDQYSVTVVGMSAGEPIYFGRSKGVSVGVDTLQEVDIKLIPYNGAACIPVKDVGLPPHRLFSASVALPDGRVFVSGGFTGFKETEDPQILSSASSTTFFFEPSTGAVTLGPELKKGRGGHSMIYVPTHQRIVIVGGAQEMEWSTDSEGIALRFASGSSLGASDIEVVELSGDVPAVLGGLGELNPRRIFPRLAMLGTDEVAIMGGGDWHKEKPGPDFKDAIIFNAKTSTLDAGIAPSDNTVRVGQTVTFVKYETAQNGNPIEVYLVWGGTRSEPMASLMRNARNNDGTSNVTFYSSFPMDGDDPERTFFHTMTPLGDDRFLAVGGVAPDESGELTRIESDFVYLIEYSNTNGDNPKLDVTNIQGLDSGRVFHSATSHDGKVVTLIGGFTTETGDVASEIVTFDVETQTFDSSVQPAGYFAPRAGHVAEVLENDGLYLLGGVSDVSDLLLAEHMLHEVFVSAGVRFCDAPVVATQGGVE